MCRSLLIAFIALCACANATWPASAQTLGRRGIFGVSAVERNGAVIVAAVIPGAPAESAGLKPGDRIVSVDGEAVESLGAFLQSVRRPAGHTLTVVVERGQQRFSRTVLLTPYPKEQDPYVTTLYGSVVVDGTLRRTLITVPDGAPRLRPAVFFVGGIGCYSIDVADPRDSYRNLAHALSRRGFVTLRLEKSGIGDSQGPPCRSVDFRTEYDSYAVALRSFAADPHVDPTRVYIFGHSIGSIIAPRLALARRPAGIIVVAAVARSWFEYELINWRRQLALSGSPPRDFDTEMERKEWCMHRALIEKQSVEATIAQRPDCKDEFPYPVTIAYLQQVAALNVLAPWTQLDVPVLVVYGASDFVTDRADHQLIADTVNSLHRGNATFAVVDDMDHYLWIMPSQAASLQNATKGLSGQYDPKLGATILDWLCARERCSPA
jgi:uncharacterized protein